MLVSFKKLRLSVLWKVQSGFGWVSAKLRYGEGGVGNCISKETPIGTENDVRDPLNTSNSEFCLLSDSLTEEGSWKEGVTNSPVASMFQFLKKKQSHSAIISPASLALDTLLGFISNPQHLQLIIFHSVQTMFRIHKIQMNSNKKS